MKTIFSYFTCVGWILPIRLILIFLSSRTKPSPILNGVCISLYKAGILLIEFGSHDWQCGFRKNPNRENRWSFPLLIWHDDSSDLFFGFLGSAFGLFLVTSSTFLWFLWFSSVDFTLNYSQERATSSLQFCRCPGSDKKYDLSFLPVWVCTTWKTSRIWSVVHVESFAWFYHKHFQYPFQCHGAYK